MPTLFSKKNPATLIDHIFCRFSKFTSSSSSGIIASKISDHLPCLSAINYCNNVYIKPKYIKVQRKGPDAILNFQNEVKSRISSTDFDTYLFADPNINFNK